jgi:hypothetical protein
MTIGFKADIILLQEIIGVIALSKAKVWQVLF